MKKQNRKNNKTPYLVVTLACALLVTGLGCATLAKYITEKDVDSASATVAKWGYVITANPENLFASSYDETGVANTNGVSVKSSSNVVAPGTTGSMTFSVIGQAEVASQTKFEVQESKDVCYALNADGGTAVTYNPIVWTLSEVTAGEIKKGTLAEVVTAINDLGKTYDAGTEVNLTYTLSWSWAFSQSHDDYDTYLGNIVANEDRAPENKAAETPDGRTLDATNTSTEVKIDLKISVEQIQKAA